MIKFWLMTIYTRGKKLNIKLRVNKIIWEVSFDNSLLMLRFDKKYVLVWVMKNLFEAKKLRKKDKIQRVNTFN